MGWYLYPPELFIDEVNIQYFKMKWDREIPNGIRAFLKCKAPLQTYFSFDELLQTLFQALCHKVCKVSEVEDLMASRPIA